MLFSKDQTTNLLAQMLEDNGIVKSNPAKAKLMAQEWLRAKIQAGNVQFINTTAVAKSLEDIQNLLKD